MSFEVKEIPVRKLLNGHTLSIKQFFFRGKNPQAPKAYIQANMHGAEIQGNAVIYHLLKHLCTNAPEGDVLLVPQCNPYGGGQKNGEYTHGRFDTSSGENWNRKYFNVLKAEDLDLQAFVKQNLETPWEVIKENFRRTLSEIFENRLSTTENSHAEYLSLIHQKSAAPYDIVLDLHTGPKATHYLYAPQGLEEEAAHMLIPYTLVIPHEFAGAMDEASLMPWSELKGEFLRQGRSDINLGTVGYTVELASEETLDMIQGYEQTQGLINYLRYKGTCAGEITPPKKEQLACKLENYKRVYTQKGGLVHYTLKPGEKVKKGETLYQILSFSDLAGPENLPQALEDIPSPYDGIVIFHSTSSSLHQGMEVYNMMTEAYPLIS